MSSIKYFTGEKNYLKRAPSSGSRTVAAPATLSAWSNYITTTTIPHGLSYIPEVRVYYEPFNDGRIFPNTGERFLAYGGGLNVGDIICNWEIDATNLTIYLESATAETGTIPIYWVIYLDY